jgi:plastocyanin
MKKLTAFTLLFLAFAPSAFAKTPEFNITIKNHVFSPASLEIPAGEKVKLVIQNQDATAEEFDSSDLNREKIISGNSKGVIFIDPLDVGEYSFMGEFNRKTAQGKLIVK